MKIMHIKRLRDQRRKRVAAYCRVSTRLEEQEESYDTQMRYYIDYISANPEWEFAGIYADEKSGTKAQNREGFQRMVADAVAGRIDLVLVKSISRFSRNTVDCQNYANYLLGNGVEVVFEREHISSADPSSSMIFSLMSAIAQDESRSIGENIRWGYQERYKRGEYNLGNNRILGYDTINRKLVPNQDAWIVRMVYRFFLEEKTYKQISDAVYEAGGKGLRTGKPLSNAAITKILRNETYVGDKLLQKNPHINFLTKKPDDTIPYESHYLQNDHEAVIDRATWNRTQEILNTRREEKKRGISRNRQESPLYGKILCGECGCAYTRRTLREYAKVRSEGNYYKAWSCRERVKGKKGCGCRNVTVKEDELLKGVSEILGWEWNGADAFDEGKLCKIVDSVEIWKDRVSVWMKGQRHCSGLLCADAEERRLQA